MAQDSGARPTPNFKWCSTCHLVKVARDFSRHRGNVHALHTDCRQCRRRKEKARYASDATYRARINRHGIKHRFGVTPEAYERMLAARSGLCAICHIRADDAPKKTLYVDHDHASGEVRALLCQRCNIALGQFRDSIEHLESVAAYLRAHSKLALVAEG